MPSIRDTAAWLTLDGERLPEYQIEVEGLDIVKCYVPSEVGKRFSIVVSDKSPQRSALVRPIISIKLDGTAIGRSWSQENFEESCVIDGIGGDDFFLPFLFDNLAVTDDDNYRCSTSTVGTVKVKVQWVGPGVPCAPPSRLIPGPTFGSDPVHEREKKLTTHRIVLGAPVPMAPSGIEWFTRPPLPQYPPVEFHFQYADKDLLMARNIIPPPSFDGPTKLKRPLDIDESDNAFTRSEEETFKLLKEKVRRKNKRIKTEVKAEVPKFKVTADGVIDLTED